MDVMKPNFVANAARRHRRSLPSGRVKSTMLIPQQQEDETAALVWIESKARGRLSTVCVFNNEGT